MQTKNFDKADYILLVSVLLCTILTGGFTWYSCIIPCFLLIIYLIIKRGNSLTWQSTILATMIAIGLVSIICSKGDKQNALYEFEKYFCLILSIYAGCKCNNKQVIRNLIIVAAALVSIVGLLAYCNIIKSSGLVFYDRKIIRLQSFIQYANTTSILLACGYFLTLNNCKKNNVMICISQCILLSFYLTVSKGGIALYLLLGTGLIFVKKEYAERFVLQNFTSLIFFLALVITAANRLHAFSFILISVCIIAGYHIAKLKMNKKTLIILWMSCLISGVIAVVILIKTTNINLFSTFEKRIEYMVDACKLIKNNLLLGVGPGAWKYYQYSVQTTQYDVRYIHNGWLQFLVENGIFFVLMLITISIPSIKKLIKNKNYDFLACAMLIALHALIDFDLSFGVVLMLFGLIIGGEISTENNKISFKTINILIISIAILTTFYMSVEYFVRNSFERNYLNKKYDAALCSARTLEKICPYDSNLQLSIAALDNTTAKECIEKARALSPLDPYLLEKCINYYIYNGGENVLDLVKEYIELMPKQEITYTNAYEFLKRIWEKGECSEEDYNNMKEYVERRQAKEQVIDRNRSLKSTVINDSG